MADDFRYMDLRIKAGVGPTGIAPPGTLIDGTKSIVDQTTKQPFKARTLSFQAVPNPGQNVDVSIGTELPPTGPLGGMVIQVKGQIEGGGWYLRRLSIGPWRALEFDISTWHGVTVELLKSTLTNYDLVGAISNRSNQSGERLTEWIYAEEYGAAGVYNVPPGALKLWPETGDGGFSWTAYTFTPPSAGVGFVTIPDAQLPSIESDVKGSAFTTTVAGFRAIWRIRL